MPNPTTSQLVMQLYNTTKLLGEELDSMNVPNVSGVYCLPSLVDSVLLAAGSGNSSYTTYTTVLNKTNTISMVLNFCPHSFAIASKRALTSTYAVSEENSFRVLGSLVLEDLEDVSLDKSDDSKVYEVEVLQNDMQIETINVTVSLVQSLSHYTLTITLPEGFFFLGENEWAVIGLIEEGVE